MPEPRAVGFLPKRLLICSYAVWLMGLENSLLRRHGWSLAAPQVPNNCFILLQEEGEKKSNNDGL